MIALDEEHLVLRRTVRDFLEAVSPESEVRRVMDTPEGHDRRAWTRLCTELGLAGLAVPEEYGGSGCGPVEVGVVMEELGRSLACLPYLSSAVLATTALLLSGDEAMCKELLPGMVEGEVLCTVAVAERSGRWDPEEIRTTAVRVPTGWQLTGEKLFVLDGCTADLVLVLARDDSGRLSLFAVAGGEARREAMPTLDPTRKQARLVLEGTAARLVGDAGAGESLLGDLRDRALVSLAAEQVGGAERCLEMAVEHARTRVQFGRPIGSFQAVKHRCADMLVGISGARSAAYYGLWAAACAPGELPVAARLAGTWSSDAFVYAAGENVHLHGGMGFTWEHMAHLYVRRARSSQLLLGDPAEHRELLAQHLGI
ncbi:MAG: acyl-CoA/acyl-ACP dehydrogenase [Actinomycetota bacterium]|nr:acyl-CoA/acyl-ACP dehydrogenase [Actinomycetota bacterium]